MNHQQVYQSLQQQPQILFLPHLLLHRIELGGTFCMGKCQQGVCVTVDGALFSVSPETVKEFFEKQVKAKLA